MERTMKYEIQANANDTITPHAIFAVNGPMVARTVTQAEAQFFVRAANLHDQLVSSLRGLLAATDAYSTTHAPDGDDAARMVEYAEALNNARAVLAAAGAA
jgi:hypothetical protein